MNTLARLLLSTSVCTLALTAPDAARAGGVVGNGTPASCTATAFATALSGGGAVTFNCGPSPHTIVITQQVIAADVIIDGGGLITLSGNDTERHFFAGPGYALTLRNITLSNGHSAVGGGSIEATGSQVTLENVRLTNNAAAGYGGAIAAEVDSLVTVRNSVVENNSAPNGAGIWVSGSGSLQVIDSRISGNSSATSGITAGGGVYALGVVTLTGAIVNGNQALDGGGLYVASGASVQVSGTRFEANGGGFGGGIENSGSLTVTNSLITSNTVANSGGGIWNLSGVISMTRSTISKNVASEGGGLNSYGSSIDLRDVAVVDNISTGGGGGIWHAGTTLFATNITISGNRATGNGGGIYQNSSDNLFFVNATIADNSAGQYGGGIYHVARYGFFINSTFGDNTAGVAGPAIYEDLPASPGPGRVDLGNSIVFGNANNCGGDMFNTSGHNIVAGTCASIVHASDQTVTDAGLGSLGFNGGGFPMHTFMPFPGSVAIDFGDAGLCATYAPQDQRGAARVGQCDAGATEFGAIIARARLPLVLRG